jgi:hypothetical protein
MPCVFFVHHFGIDIILDARERGASLATMSCVRGDLKANE